MIKHYAHSITVEETLTVGIQCSDCETSIDIADLSDTPKVIAQNSIYFFCNFLCLCKWAIEYKKQIKKLKESGTET